MSKFVSEEDGLNLWAYLGNVLARAVAASSARVFIHHPSHLHHRSPRGLQLIVDDQLEHGRYKLGRFVSLSDGAHIAARAVAEDTTVLAKGSDHKWEVAIPIRSRIEGLANPLAVVVLDVEAADSSATLQIVEIVNSLLAQVWPICTYASIRLVTPGAHELRLGSVIDTVLDGLCGLWGFEFATISLVDEDNTAIRTEKARGEAQEWLHMAQHPLDSGSKDLDIQSWVVKTGGIRVVRGWDPLLDSEIYHDYGHEDLVRVFLPLGTSRRIGTIEAGFRIRHGTRDHIPSALVDALTRYALFDVTPAVQQAVLSERGSAHLQLLQHLHDISRDLQSRAAGVSEREWLEQVVSAAQELFASEVESEPLVILHMLKSSTNGSDSEHLFADPIFVGELKGKRTLKPANHPDNIVQFIASEGVYFQAHVHKDPRFLDTTNDPKAHSFSRAQRTRSFAGVPLFAQEELLGVLTINFRRRRDFNFHDRQIIELFAQQVAVILLSQRQVRTQERNLMAHDLHDAVKSHVMSIHRFLRVADRAMPPEAERLALVRDCFDEIRHTTSGILKGVELIRHDYRQRADQLGMSLRSLLIEDLERFSKQTSATLTYSVDEYFPAFPLRLQMTTVWLIEQAVSNAIQHSEAHAIAVRVQCRQQQLILEVEDDGLGFDVEKLRIRPHRGLSIMDERTREIDGILAVFSPIENSHLGTLVRITIPLKG